MLTQMLKSVIDQERASVVLSDLEQRIVIFASPLVFLTLLPDIIFLRLAETHIFFWLVSLCNCAGCFFDLLGIVEIIHNRKK